MVSAEGEAGGLRPVLRHYWPQSLPVSLIHRHPRQLARRLTLFVDFVAARFGM